jgi:hypothetical protein
MVVSDVFESANVEWGKLGFFVGDEEAGRGAQRVSVFSCLVEQYSTFLVHFA